MCGNYFCVWRRPSAEQRKVDKGDCVKCLLPSCCSADVVENTAKATAVSTSGAKSSVQNAITCGNDGGGYGGCFN